MIKRYLTAAAVSLLMAAGLIGASSPTAAASGPGGQVVYAATPPRPTKHDKLLVNHRRIAKNPPPTTGVHTLLGVPYWYGGGHQDLTSVSPQVTTVGANFGGTSSWYLDSTNDTHTLYESAVRKTYNSNSVLIEAGVTVDPALNGGSSPTLFVYWWDASGVGQGYNSGFTLYGGRTYTPGTSVITATASIQWVYSSGLWWLALAGTWVGYFNTTNWPGVTFDHAGEWLGFGEVAQKPGGTRTYSCSDMANGLDSSNASALGITSVSYNSSGTGVNLSIISTAGTGFSAQLFSGSTRSLRYGGPGLNSVGGSPGNTGSC